MLGIWRVGILLVAGLLIGFRLPAYADQPVLHHGSPSTGAQSGQKACAPLRVPGETGAFQGIQIETSDLGLHELFFEHILRAHQVQRRDHPGVDSLRGYCYRGVLVVVRQDLRSPRPTGWAQLNFVVEDAAALQAELEAAYRASPVNGRPDADKIVRIRLKPDVRRGDCRAVRLEVGGPEGFMIGFDQFKDAACR